jgi:hypothetical protein
MGTANNTCNHGNHVEWTLVCALFAGGTRIKIADHRGLLPFPHFKAKQMQRASTNTPPAPGAAGGINTWQKYTGFHGNQRLDQLKMQ